MMKTLWDVLKETVREFSRTQPAELAGAISFFSILSITPILAIALSIVALLYDPAIAEGQVTSMLDLVLSAEVIDALIVQLERSDPVQSRGVTVIGAITLLVAGTALFAQLQRALNRVWGVRPKFERSFVALLRGRGLGFLIALLLGVLFLLLIAVDALLITLGEFVQSQFALPGVANLIFIGESLLSFGLLVVLIAVVFRILPDAIIAWRDVWVGAVVTALLFTLGQGGIGLYLRNSSLISSSGAAILLLLWVYYSSYVFLFGAQFTRIFARRFGERIEPKPYAVRIPSIEDTI